MSRQYSLELLLQALVATSTFSTGLRSKRVLVALRPTYILLSTQNLLAAGPICAADSLRVEKWKQITNSVWTFQLCTRLAANRASCLSASLALISFLLVFDRTDRTTERPANRDSSQALTTGRLRSQKPDFRLPSRSGWRGDWPKSPP
ncbi:unnamed protein product [Protopolystoma xenopodis]|uniref:Uncharacterized protein n=1 Tax=Protopolystoma xenopodis TaxID=117903 RepID=A0A448X1C0_9PLAT|nr:unnamed protein product [Protopolystoma xenopodis]